MNISVECYEELYLKNKNVEEVNAEVENIRRYIERIKYEMEAPAFSYEDRFYPSLILDISMCKKYLSSALSALSKLKQGEDVLTEEEKSGLIFDGECENISRICLTLGMDFEKKYELIIDELSAAVMVWQKDSEPVIHVIDRKEAVNDIYDLHMGEWHELYTPEQYDCMLDDPIKWNLCIDYGNGAASRNFEGIGIFPYNFKSVCKLLGAEFDIK